MLASLSFIINKGDKMESQSGMSNRVCKKKAVIVHHIKEWFPALKPVTLFTRVFFYAVHWKEMVKKDRIVNSARAKESP